MLCFESSSTASGKAKPLVETHNLISGASSLKRRKVSKVRSGFANGSPGPAMPNTVICGMVAATAMVFLTA